MKSPRLYAFEILDGILRRNAYSNIALDSALKNCEKENRAFISQLVYGVIERRLTLEYIVNMHLKGKTKPKVKTILYLGAYQIYFIENIPVSVAVNETVKLCSETGLAYYKGLVNAVLHSVADNRIDIDSLENLSVRYSCPQELINMWEKQYSRENMLEILNTVNEKPPFFAVPNSLKVTADRLVEKLKSEGVESEEAFGIVKITSPFNLHALKSFDEGLFHIEDLSSYLCACELEADEGDTVLDICSAPGGKAFTVAEKMNNKGALYAFDLYEHRVELVKQGAERLGITNIVAEVNDAEHYNAQLPEADRILCDVPCSGFGVIRRKPEIRYKNLDSLSGLPLIQYKILETSSKYLKKGGRIIYSTCTLNKKENEKVTGNFIDNNREFRLIKEKTVFPSQNGGDGFYYAVIEKKND